MYYFLIVLMFIIINELYCILSNFNYNKLEQKYINTLNSVQIKIVFWDKLHRKIKYISGWNKYFPKLNIYNFIFLSSILMTLAYTLFYSLTKMITASLLLGFVAFVVPHIVLNIWCDKRNTALSSEMVTFISLMSRWSIIKDDVYYCIEKSSEKIQEPLKGYMEKFLFQVKYSGLADQGFQILLLYSDNALYRNFVINMRQASYSKGDLCQLLERLEEEAYLIEGEHSRLISETYFDRIIIGATAGCALLICGFMLVRNPLMRSFYFHQTIGQILLTSYICLFLMALYVTGKITDFNY